MSFKPTLEHAQKLDSKDELSHFRKRFHIPKHEGQEAVYLCGNSLGLQPKSAKNAIGRELKDWAKFGVEGHFRGKNPWLYYHKFLKEASAEIIGAKPVETVIMNSLTVNLHLMMVSFYQPTKKRFKIIMEADAFPSDHYAMASQAEFHGFEAEKAVIQLYPRKGEVALRTEDILAKIEEEGDELALVMLGGVNYYTGQFFELEKITKKAHSVGAFCGFDLAHAVGNVKLELHKWKVDFAVWCTYKYLNSGPGGSSGVFVHETHSKNKKLPRFAGWWGHNEEERFLMDKKFKPMVGADGWQLSNAQILPMAVHKASLEIFEEAGMENLLAKSKKLTGYLEFLVGELNNEQDKLKIKIITPESRGCQLSLVFSKHGKKVYNKISKKGVIADWREPDVIRIAPVPLYNSFEDVFRFYELLKETIGKL
ncbi:MAG: kynureninase [Arenicella sp.]|jgi:kynureninase